MKSVVEKSPRGRFVRSNEVIGSGSQKVVYKGQDREQGCEVAWNAINLQTLSEKELSSLQKEITLIKQLKHPNIIQCRGAWVSGRHHLVFITELLSGGDLKSYLHRIHAPRRCVVKNWCRDILSGLHYLHTQSPPIIHRDIKTENVFIDSSTGKARIGDLGLSTVLMASHSSSFAGTPCFMAPEMYDENYGKEVDIYAFGMCLLEMCTMETPYSECGTTASVYRKIIEGVPPSCLDQVGDLEIHKFLLKTLSPKETRPTAYQLLQEPFLNTSHHLDKEPICLDKQHKNKQVNPTTSGSIEISMNVQDLLGNPQLIKFNFYFDSDTPNSVATEMVKELGLNVALESILASEISKIVRSRFVSTKG